jgi:hypothetical protein
MANLAIVQHLKLADHVICISALGEAPVEGSIEDLQKRNIILSFLDRKATPLQNSEIADSDLREPSAMMVTHGTRASPTSNTDTSLIAGDKKVLTYYMKSLGSRNMLIFWTIGILCAGAYKVSGSANPSYTLSSANF